MAKKPTTKKPSNPTVSLYGGLSTAYEHFNRELFGGCLPHCVITMRSVSHSYGYYCGKRFIPAHDGKPGESVDEIAINPSHVAERSVEKTLSTLVHEMAHQWQHHHGKEPTRCYHDKQWAAKMKEVGLYPSSTAAPGGKETGAKVSHYIIEGGPFAKTCAAFLKANKPALYQDVSSALAALRKPRAKAKAGGEEEGEGGEENVKSTGRAKFTCKGCDLNAWAKPSAKLRCGTCDRPMHTEEESNDDDED